MEHLISRVIFNEKRQSEIWEFQICEDLESRRLSNDTVYSGGLLLHPPLSYFYFDESDVSHDLAQGHTSLKSQGYTRERIL
jgi:hypothetical protein